MRGLQKSPGHAPAAIAVLYLAAAMWPSGPTAAAEYGLGGNPAAACGALSSAGGGATSVDASGLVEATPAPVADKGPTPASRISPATQTFCRMLGHIAPGDPTAPQIRFEVNLPLQWNGRSVQYGGGGSNGVLVTGTGLPRAAPFDGPTPLARGFVTYGTDSGHESKPGEPSQLFAGNDEAFVNFAHASYKKVRDAAMAVIERAYGIKPRNFTTWAALRAGAKA